MMKLTAGGADKYSNFKKLFVIGPPRSGTTLLHALCCTADNANDYVSECSFITGLLRNFQQGRNNMKTHNEDFFGSEGLYNQYNGALVRQVLGDTWESLGRPETLVLKDPQMTAAMVEVLELMPDVRFLVSVRNPTDTLKSRIKVLQRSNVAISPAVAQKIMAEYAGFYTLALRCAEVFPRAVLFCSYEAMIEQSDKTKLAKAVGLDAIDETRLWKPARNSAKHFRDKNDPWVSSKYGGGINAEKQNEEIDISSYGGFIGQATGVYDKAKASSVL